MNQNLKYFLDAGCMDGVGLSSVSSSALSSKSLYLSYGGASVPIDWSVFASGRET